MNAIVCSKDRAGQLDLFLRSLQRFRRHPPRLQILYNYSTDGFREGYDRLKSDTHLPIDWIDRLYPLPQLVNAAADPRQACTVLFCS